MTAAFDTGGGKVARLDRKRAARDAAAGKPGTRASQIMQHCRRRLREQLHASLPGILDQVDDALFDLADKADSNQLQSTYFEAMRSMRLCREELELRFLGALDDAVEARVSPAGTDAGARQRGVVLSLVDPEELEESVAVKNVAAKIRNLCREDLFALDRRVALLLSNPTVEGEDNPLAPEVICDAARVALGVTDTGLEVRLLVLKLFDRHLTRVAERFYPELNAWLVGQGVLPDVSAAVTPHPQGITRRGPRREAAPSPDAPELDADPWAEDARDEGWEQFHGGAGSAPASAPGGTGGPRGARPAGAPDTAGEARRQARHGPGDGHGAASHGGAAGLSAQPDGGGAGSVPAVDGAASAPGTAFGDGAAGLYAQPDGGEAGSAPAGEGVASAPGRTAAGGAPAGGATARERPASTAARGARAGNGHGPAAAPAGIPGGPRGEQVLGVLNEVMRVGGGAEQGEPAPGREHFLVSLTAMQRESGAAGAAGNVLRELKGHGAARGVSHLDGLMIDVVAMMFDYILEDPNIGDRMRALIGRLQIPVLKVAILDKSFFARRSHPARSFVNKLAELGARLHGGDPDHAPLLLRVHAIVKRILDHFDAELDVFAAAQRELDAVLAEEDETLKRGAWSSTHAAQARERLMRARRTAEVEVTGRLEFAAPPETVAGFLREHWRHLLGERLFREGQEGEGWRAGVQTMDQLLWSVTPKKAPVERERLLAQLPFLLDRLKSGMQELGLAEPVRGPWLHELSKLHIAALRGVAPEAPPASPATPEAPPARASAAPAAAPSPDPAPDPGARTAARLDEAVQRANALVWETAARQPQCEGMGATVVAVKLCGEALVCAHAGDSRLYRLREGVLAAITEDHTYRREAVARGLVAEEDAAQIAGNMITRAVGGGDAIEVEVKVHRSAPGDLYLCCSDGLSDMLDDARIASLLVADPDTADLDALAERLVAAANEAGGRDNVSVGLLRIDEALPEATDGGEPRDYGAFVRMAARTDPGRRRAHNEDCIASDTTAGALVLADGMGGHNAGEVASAMTVEVVMEALGARRPGVPAEPAAAQGVQALFWDEQLAAGDAAVEHIVLEGGGDPDACFDGDGDGEAATLQGAGAASEVAHLARDAARDPLLERVLRLRCGTWVEFGERAGDGVRAHLSWIAPGGARFLFTDRAGNKVSDATPHGLAVELRAGRLRVLDGAPLFERAVGALTKRLRDAQDQPPRDGHEELPRDAFEVPRRDVSDAPRRDVSDAPRRDVSDAPRRDVSDAPRRDVSDAPRRDVSDAPRRDVSDAPRRDVSDAPRRDVSDAPRRDGQDARERGARKLPAGRPGVGTTVH